MKSQRRPVSVILTVRNDRDGCRVTLDSLLAQVRIPEEIIVVDAGSTDGTGELLKAYAERNSHIRVVSAPGLNIAAGRNRATEEAGGEIIAATDGGCRAAPDWLERLSGPFEDEPPAEFVAGFYQVDSDSLFESVVGLATMRGQLAPVNPETFNPSGRSMAYTKDVWRRAGGWPEWIRFSEDTLFDMKLRQMGVCWKFVPDAVVRWQPRSTLRALAKQFYCYGTGRGHTQIGAPDFRYNLRNLGLLGFAVCIGFFQPLALGLAGVLALYFYVWSFHSKARAIQRRLNTWKAYPLCICVMWIVLFSNLLGYLVGSAERVRGTAKHRRRLQAYLAT